MGAANDIESGVPIGSRCQPGDLIAAKYQVERVIGTGGMGVVVEATHVQLGHSVAIKLLRVDESQRVEATTRFLREGRAAAGLKGDHVVRIYDVGTLDDGSPFMVMELLRGKDLSDLLDTRGSLEVSEAVEFVFQAASAIAEAHDNGIVHRDLKPSNLFVTERTDGTPSIKVLDFGISKSMGAEASLQGNLTATRSVLGSPYYMSPEQVRDAKKVDARSDIWALGVILQELLTGEPVFKADTLPGICAAIAADAPAPLRTLRPDAPTELEAVILKCLEKDPAARYQTVRELMSALSVLRRGRPSQASRDDALSATMAMPGKVRGNVPTLAAAGPPIGAPAADVAGGLVGSDRPSRKSGQQLIQLGADQTSLSAGVKPPDSHSARRPPSRRKGVYLLVAVGLAAVCGAVWYGGLGGKLESNPPLPAESTLAVMAFELSLESSPSGADVYENERKLGQTPFRLRVEKGSLKSGPRAFSVRHPGYQPYSFVQGDSAENVRVFATLQAEASEAPKPSALPSVAPTAPPSVAPAPPPAERPTRRPGSRPKAKVSVQESPSDIRMQR
ncbi:MAG: serine/threonine-protein kinase [Polyangiaceae bacterium]|nr:serine/threonine-protein kinase [Polyangiaceae bacterium]